MPLDERLEMMAHHVRAQPPGDIDVEAALAATRARVLRPSGRRRPILAVAAVLLAVAVGAAAVRIVTAGSGSERVRSGSPAGQAPPPVDQSKPYLWLGAAQVPASGGDLPVVLIAPTGTGEVFGVGVELERWNGAAWTGAGSGSVCLDSWNCIGEIGPGQDIPAIGLSPEGAGPLMWLRLGQLEPGWYRLSSASNAGVRAAGQFEVTVDAPVLPPTDNLGSHLSVEPLVRLTTMSSTLATVTPIANDMPMFDGWQDGSVTVDRWNGSRWVATRSSPMRLLQRTADGAEDQWLVDVGVRPPGAYRLTVKSDTQEVSGRFWMVEGNDLDLTPSTAGAPVNPTVDAGPEASPTITALAQDGSCRGSSFPALTDLVPGDALGAQSFSGTTALRIKVPPEPGVRADRSWITIEIAPPVGPLPSAGEEDRYVDVTTATSTKTATFSTYADVGTGGDDGHVLHRLVWDDGDVRVNVEALNVGLDGMLERVRHLEIVDRAGFIESLAAHGVSKVCSG